MEVFQKHFSSVPILVCLTQADRLYESQYDKLHEGKYEDDVFPVCSEGNTPKLKMQLEDELEVCK